MWRSVSRDMPGDKIPPPSCWQTSQKTVAGRSIYNAHFQTVCIQNNVYVESSYFAQNASIFTCSHRDVNSFPGTETPRPLLTGVGKGWEGEGMEGERILPLQ